MGGKSSSTSKVSLKNEQLYINSNTFNSLNKSISENISETIISSSSSCSSTAANEQNIVIEDIDNTGCAIQASLNIVGIGASQQIKMTFKCKNVSDTYNEVVTTLNKNILSDIKNNNSTDILAKMDSNAKAKAETGFLATGDAKSVSVSEQDLKIRQENTTIANITNVVENIVKNNFKEDSLKKCMSTLQGGQTINLGKIRWCGDVNIRDIALHQLTNIVSDCLNITQVSNVISTQIRESLGVKLTSENLTVVTTDQTGKSEATATVSGFSIGMSAISLLCFIMSFVFAAFAFYVYSSQKSSR